MTTALHSSPPLRARESELEEELMDTNVFFNEYFPMTVKNLLARKLHWSPQSLPAAARVPYVTSGMREAASAYLAACWPDGLSNLKDMMFGIQQAQVILSKISTEQILYLIFQILQKHGMLAVGEVGKHIQELLGGKGPFFF